MVGPASLLHSKCGRACTYAGAPVGKPSRTSICAVSCKVGIGNALAATKSFSWQHSTCTPVAQETATTPARGQREASEQRPLLGAVAATATAITLLLIGAPHADAVSGGGGISTPLSGQDFSGQDLRKRAYTKAVLRKTNFAGANLTGVSCMSRTALHLSCRHWLAMCLLALRTGHAFAPPNSQLSTFCATRRRVIFQQSG